MWVIHSLYIHLAKLISLYLFPLFICGKLLYNDFITMLVIHTCPCPYTCLLITLQLLTILLTGYQQVYRGYKQGRVEVLFISQNINVYSANNDILGYYMVQKNTPVCHYLCYQLQYLLLTATVLPATCHNTCCLFTTLITGIQQVINSYFKKLSTHYSYFSTLFLWFIRHLSTGFVNIVQLIISILHSYPHFYVVQYMLVMSVSIIYVFLLQFILSY